MAYLLSQNDWKKIIEHIKNIESFYFISGLFIPLLIIPFLATLRWKILLSPASISLDFWTLLKLTYTGLFFNLVLPGSVGGDTVKGIIFYRLTKNSSVSASSIVLDRVIGLLALTILSAAASGIYYSHSSDTTFIIISGGFLAVLLIFISSIMLPPVQNIIISITRLIKYKKLEEFTQKSLEFLSWFQKHPKILFLTLLISFISHILSMILCYSTGLSLGLKISIEYYFLFFPLIALIFSIPISIAGFGLREVAFVHFFSRVGVSEEISISLSLLFFFQCMTGGILGGIIYMLSSFPSKEEIMRSES